LRQKVKIDLIARSTQSSILSAEAAKGLIQKEYVMLRFTSSLFNKLFRSQTLSRSYSRPWLCRRAAARTVVALVVLSLLPTSTPAATVTIVELATESQANLGFWFRSLNLLTQLSQRLSPEPEHERQAARDLRVGRIVILPDDVTLQEGQKISFAAVAYDNDGNAVSGVNFKWKAWHEERGREVAISPLGDFNAIAAGNFKLSVEGAGAGQTQKSRLLKESAGVKITIK
jgi:hypothetical protein